MLDLLQFVIQHCSGNNSALVDITSVVNKINCDVYRIRSIAEKLSLKLTILSINVRTDRGGYMSVCNMML